MKRRVTVVAVLFMLFSLSIMAETEGSNGDWKEWLVKYEIFIEAYIPLYKDSIDGKPVDNVKLLEYMTDLAKLTEEAQVMVGDLDEAEALRFSTELSIITMRLYQQ